MNTVYSSFFIALICDIKSDCSIFIILPINNNVILLWSKPHSCQIEWSRLCVFKEYITEPSCLFIFVLTWSLRDSNVTWKCDCIWNILIKRIIHNNQLILWVSSENVYCLGSLSIGEGELVNVLKVYCLRIISKR